MERLGCQEREVVALCDIAMIGMETESAEKMDKGCVLASGSF